MRRYPDCQREDSNCEMCSLSNYGRDCHNSPVNAIAYVRTKAGMTQAQLADKIGVKQSQIANWETGYRNPKLASLKKIAAVCTAKIEEII